MMAALHWRNVLACVLACSSRPSTQLQTGALKQAAPQSKLVQAGTRWQSCRRRFSDRPRASVDDFSSRSSGDIPVDLSPSPIPAAPKRGGGTKSRLDALALELYPQYSRTLVQSWILQGKVLVDGLPVTKAGTAVSHDSEVTIVAEDPKYVCRAGHKLEAALDAFGFDVAGKVALDSGLSTGGFTDCLLQRGAKRVYGVDVGYGQVADRIRNDPRVVVMERCNVRHLKELPELVDLASLDLSFISVLKVLPAVKALLKPEGRLVVLIKPQFEAMRGEVGRGGVVRDPAVHEEVIRRVTAGAQALGFQLQGSMPSPLKGAKEGNTEFLAAFVNGPSADPQTSSGQVHDETDG